MSFPFDRIHDGGFGKGAVAKLVIDGILHLVKLASLRILSEKQNVYAVFRSFKDKSEHTRGGWEHKRIEPRYVKRKKGEVLKIKEVRRSYAQRKGKRLQVHFVIHCTGDRYFHLVYDADKIIWILLYEFDDQMLFDEKEVDVEIKWHGLNNSPK